MSKLSPQQERLKALYPEPRREQFPDEQSWQEALASYRHRIGPLLRPSPGSPESSRSPAE